MMLTGVVVVLPATAAAASSMLGDLLHFSANRRFEFTTRHSVNTGMVFCNDPDFCLPRAFITRGIDQCTARDCDVPCRIGARHMWHVPIYPVEIRAGESENQRCNVLYTLVQGWGGTNLWHVAPPRVGHTAITLYLRNPKQIAASGQGQAESQYDTWILGLQPTRHGLCLLSIP